MRNKFSSLFVVCLLSSLSAAVSPAAAGPSASSPKQIAPQYQGAIGLFNGGRYAQALTAFEAIARKTPTDGTAHYYIGLCCQSLHQNSRAAQEFRYVASSASDPQLRFMAQKGYDSLAKLHASSSQPSVSALTSSLASPSSLAAAPRVSRVKKVIEFYTTWCHVCTEFADTFESTKAKYSGRIQFEQLNAEDPENSELKAKYNVKAYPTLIFLDASGTVLRRGEGAPMGPRFANIIESL
jgi:thiol-disulfide isomerase/thioredoxin